MDYIKAYYTGWRINETGILIVYEYDYERKRPFNIHVVELINRWSELEHGNSLSLSYVVRT